MKRSPMTLRSLVSVLALVAPLTAVAVSCSGSSSSSPNPAPTPQTTTPGGTAPATPSPSGSGTAALSASFITNCGTSCHGKDGSNTSVLTNGKKLQHTSLTQAQYSAKVRAGITPATGSSMAPYSAAVISDADIATDWATLSKP